jgi:hypothetical protein
LEVPMIAGSAVERDRTLFQDACRWMIHGLSPFEGRLSIRELEHLHELHEIRIAAAIEGAKADTAELDPAASSGLVAA